MRISSRMHLRSSSDGNKSAGSGVGYLGDHRRVRSQVPVPYCVGVKVVQRLWLDFRPLTRWLDIFINVVTNNLESHNDLLSS